MNERRDDTTEPAGESRGRYYYDDATGYEVYKPEEGEGEAAGAPPGEDEAGEANGSA